MFGRNMIFHMPGNLFFVQSLNHARMITVASGSRSIKSSVKRMTPPCGKRRWKCVLSSPDPNPVSENDQKVNCFLMRVRRFDISS